MSFFAKVTDTSHTAGLTMHATILAYMFSLVESEKITVPLGQAAENNITYIQVSSQAHTLPHTHLHSERTDVHQHTH